MIRKVNLTSLPDHLKFLNLSASNFMGATISSEKIIVMATNTGPVKIMVRIDSGRKLSEVMSNAFAGVGIPINESD